ncbi:MAG: hypothetical protein BAA01_02220 [Bacillus thermozeamaize]|uniref:Polymerase beta nucleotidyltransferase domain-containing protein n=1 Tax=Bacillus thermozeamaize TaxID=230954 RepID=A0A1Y3PWX8_9BACI|nr:MAG: hypothetical protein BAA01_02220 [Bacillus thermozeamaize]
MNGLKLLKEKKQEILAIAQQNGIRNVRIFGSVARGKERLDSDIDLLVEIEDGRTLFDLIRFKQEIESLLERKVDVLTDQAVHELLREQIMNEVIQL